MRTAVREELKLEAWCLGRHEGVGTSSSPAFARPVEQGAFNTNQFREEDHVIARSHVRLPAFCGRFDIWRCPWQGPWPSRPCYWACMLTTYSPSYYHIPLLAEREPQTDRAHANLCQPYWRTITPDRQLNRHPDPPIRN